MKRTAWSLGAVVCLLGLAAFAGCSVSSGGAAQGTGDAGPGPSADASEDVQTPEDATVDAGEDASDCTSALPTLLSCTGLYTNVSAQTIASGVQPYAPAVALWADGSDKNRWILLPAGATIDRTDPNNWVFPSGTKVWKEFSRDGERKETRSRARTAPRCLSRTARSTPCRRRPSAPSATPARPIISSGSRRSRSAWPARRGSRFRSWRRRGSSRRRRRARR